MQKFLSTIAIASTALIGAADAQATTVNLASGSGLAAINYGTTNVGAYSSATPRSGVYYMYRDGAPFDQIQDLVQQTYFYRIGGSGPATEINTGTTVSLVTSSANTATIKYSHSQFDMTVSYVLQGSPVGTFTNSLQQIITVQKKVAGNLNLSLFTYADYTLTGVSAVVPTPGDPYADNDVVNSVADGYEFVKLKSGGNGADQYDYFGNPTGLPISQLVTTYNTPVNVSQVGLGGSGSGTLLEQLTGATPDLTQSALTPFGGQLGDGHAVNVAFAGQWNLSFSNIDTLEFISDTTLIVPEPTTFGLLALAAAPALLRRRSQA